MFGLAVLIVLLGPHPSSSRVIHRIEGVTDLSLVECSAAFPGWENDVVRISDAYGGPALKRHDSPDRKFVGGRQ